jgi:hypothetical protein
MTRPAAYGVLGTVGGIDVVVAGAAADIGDLAVVRKEGVASRSTVERIGAGPIAEEIVPATAIERVVARDLALLVACEVVATPVAV